MEPAHFEGGGGVEKPRPKYMPSVDFSKAARGLQITRQEENASTLPAGLKTLLPLRTDVSPCKVCLYK